MDYTDRAKRSKSKTVHRSKWTKFHIFLIEQYDDSASLRYEMPS